MSKLLLILGAAVLLGTTLFMMQATPNQSMLRESMVSEKNVADWMAWKQTHNKKYSSQDSEEYRMMVFVENQRFIAEQNANQDDYVLGENALMDYTNDEFAQVYLTLQSTGVNRNAPTVEATDFKATDWNAQGKVSAVKNQGSCGSCWAFSAVASLESLELIKTKDAQLFSEQQLVDCSRLFGNLGCQGGLMDNAFKYIVKHDGITTEGKYPYTGKNGLCKFHGGDFKISGHTNVEANDCQDLAKALEKQPVSVAVDASQWSFYKSGTFSNCKDSLNHGVLLTAIQQDGTWVIKNSWGPAWGLSGYIHLKSGNTCGLCQDASYPNYAKK